ncbi:Tetracyclin repressor, C-terminal all-alpha domain [Nonomuraea solani]|uniref:Tetracyclin repressor, C-terminal all-alpha domain n=1 Tax=Nonomuraea solani TaxID=1144553 RepID=A0A1H6BQY4_9ACTN|nr:TetR/AcrR family transcriptional regulator C-terminal domain-containing protein [Nonomuraea solani]SEG63118.1 Tetracyclin repressor, C-terminal all-alpha domain [Nonomuraea solani]
MGRVEETPRARSRRAVGVRAGLTLQRIIDAARSLDPDDLTMQAVADALGVDRKALNHHVNDRETLLAMVAMEAFSDSFSSVEIDGHCRWQDACRAFARAFADSVFAAGNLAEHLRLSDAHVTRVLEPSEAVLKKMVHAGFDDEAAMRSLSLLANICLAYVRDANLASRSGVPPRPVILRKALEQRDPHQFETLTRIAALPVTTYDDVQFELGIETFILGTEALRERMAKLRNVDTGADHDLD